MTDRTRRRVAGGALVATFAFFVAGVILHVVTRDVAVEFYGIRGFQGFFGLIFAAFGWLIATRRVRNPLGWIFLGIGVVSAIQGFAAAYTTYSIDRHGGSWPLTEVIVWLSVWIWVLIVGPLTTLVLLLFPDGALETRGQRRIAAFAGASILVLAAAISMTPGQAGESPKGVTNPYAIESLSRVLSPIGSVLFLIAAALSVRVLVRRFRASTGDLRQQMKLLTFAGAIGAVALAASLILFGSGDTATVLNRVVSIAVILGMGGIPVAAGIAVLRYGLYEIDVVINRTVFYGALAIFITVLYAAVVVGFGALIGSGASTELSIVATAIVALVIQPVRARAHQLANRVVFGKRSSPYEALSEFAARLSDQAGDALPELARLVTEATAADRASVWLAVGTELRPVAVWPHGDGEAPVPVAGETPSIPGWEQVHAVRHEGEFLGAIAVAARAGEPLGAVEERLLSDLASQAGLLLRNSRLIEELRASRQRLVAAQDLERRRIERDLHDGAQQQLVALAVNLGLLGQIVTEPPEAATMIEQVRAGATEALENLRDLARGIYPPLLAERGLVAALSSQAEKAPVAAEVEGDGLGRYPQQVESALYFCALEALQNVGKYAGASRAIVRLFADDGGVGFEVGDDGAGFDVRTAKRGSGMTNMADRLDALGGRLEVESSPGAGTIVRGWVPATPV